jgi:tryptophanyl-tRNA synthetase
VDELLARKAALLSLDDAAAAPAADAAAPSADAGGSSADAGAAPHKQVVTPFAVDAGPDAAIDYSALVRDFGTTLIDAPLLERLARIAEARGMELHPWLRRGLFFSHRELNTIVDAHEKGEPFYLYTGRGPSSAALHFGHLMPFMFTKYLQKLFQCPLVVQLTDDEKMMWKDIKPDEMEKMLRANVKDIIAVGFDPADTFIFQNTTYMGHLWPTVVQVAKRITGNVAMHSFGFTLSDNIGKFVFPAIQAAPSFPTAFPLIFGTNQAKLRKIRCLVPCAIDQDPFFRLCRDVAPRLKMHKPAVVHSRFFPALQGANSKMSASSATSAIYVTDTDNQIKNKINKHAFSGGRATLEEHRELGGMPDVDVSFQYLCVFMDDDVELARIRAAYESGEMLTSELKAILIAILQRMVKEHQTARAKIDDALVDEFLRPRKLAAFPDFY